ncbi:cytochrome b [Photobacterium sp. OFAV2-7]|uniref:cytochrome b n=1 Tax=Photobacterium sp. OFAV2-7 TaxID=2917748 RepID=UPI001EF4A3EC|nr:cytochrome b/b6 domain-containing protein [Photobacterium sp. OFAV2-7]MCG7588679.1 cytochrome b/b6 domain-containing protein [Photobacterium sp. OFAV2-7]
MNHPHYDTFSRFLHWAMALVIIYTSIAGFSMHLVQESHPKVWHFLSVLNMSLATLAIPLFIVRLVWRYFRHEPDLPEEIPLKQRQLAKMTHSLIYFVMFMVFSSGLLMLDKGYLLFGILFIPNVITESSVNELFFQIHRYSCISLALLVLAHACAALKHHFIGKNDVLRCMTSGSRSKKSSLMHRDDMPC